MLILCRVSYLYCFEQNGLLYGVLEELGFSPKLFLGRVIHNQDTHPGLTHRITMVEYEGQQYVLDVGFGFLGPRFPVPMPEVEPNDGKNNFRIAERRPGADCSDEHSRVAHSPNRPERRSFGMKT
jgi:N-hydroxyarylamine O-acetyltransferase